jgi:hypothetical protein
MDHILKWQIRTRAHFADDITRLMMELTPAQADVILKYFAEEIKEGSWSQTADGTSTYLFTIPPEKKAFIRRYMLNLIYPMYFN